MRWDIYLVSDGQRSRGRTHSDIITQAICAGVDLVQLRDGGISDVRLAEVGRILRGITRDAGVTLIVNGHVDFALAIGADGVHLEPGDQPVGVARRFLGPSKIIGITVRTVDEAVAAEKDGADYVAVGPVFSSPEQPTTTPIAPAGAAAVKRSVSIRVLAFGGIDAGNVDQVIQHGVDGIMVGSLITGSPDIPQAVQTLRAAIEAAHLGRT